MLDNLKKADILLSFPDLEQNCLAFSYCHNWSLWAENIKLVVAFFKSPRISIACKILGDQIQPFLAKPKTCAHRIFFAEKRLQKIFEGSSADREEKIARKWCQNCTLHVERNILWEVISQKFSYLWIETRISVAPQDSPSRGSQYSNKKQKNRNFSTKTSRQKNQAGSFRDLSVWNSTNYRKK